MSEDKRARWRLVLGPFACRALPGTPSDEDARLEETLAALYGAEYGRRGVATSRVARKGSRAPSLPYAPDWLHAVKELFPADACDILARHAVERYGLTEILTDENALAVMRPDMALLSLLLSWRQVMEPRVLGLARELIKQVVDDLQRRLSLRLHNTLRGRVDPTRRTRFKNARNLDWKRTVRANLSRWDPERRRLLATDLVFRARVSRHIPWHLMLVVDCSGSMVRSVIHAAVMAGIFRALPATRVTLLCFDTKVVDLSALAGDPVELLMTVQLGGGTDIGGAVAAAAAMVEDPSHTAMVLVTDFYEGGPPGALVQGIRNLRGDGVRVLGLAALDENAQPSYDRQLAAACVEAGADVAAMTPAHLADWVAGVLR